MPTFLNLGRDNDGARDGYVYSYFIRPTWGPGSAVTGRYGFDVHKPGHVFLTRVPKEAILKRPTKWLSADGTRFTLVFTGKNSNDSWNTVAGKFILRSGD